MPLSNRQQPALRETLLLVDDDAALLSLVGGYLAAAGYEVANAGCAADARRILRERSIDAVVLDVMMPGESGLSLARHIAEEGNAGIIIVSALGTEADRIAGLDIGADDYLPKPVSPRELLARIKALLRRRALGGGTRPAAFQYCFAGWELDPVHRVLRDPQGVLISLSEGEFKLLLALVEQPGSVLTRDILLESVRGVDSEAFDRAVDTQVSRLRRKLQARGGADLIRTVRNEGYRLTADVARR
ncbi:MAG: response regulator transcription factor [Sphingomonadales bacterium]|nr:response regulator transcription factor [Sphingomonadales bacterium]